MNNERKAAEVEEPTIGRWGKAWQRFMQENYPNEAAELKKSNRWDELAFGSCSVSSTQRQIPARLPLWKQWSGRTHEAFMLTTRLWSRLCCSSEREITATNMRTGSLTVRRA